MEKSIFGISFLSARLPPITEVCYQGVKYYTNPPSLCLSFSMSPEPHSNVRIIALRPAVTDVVLAKLLKHVCEKDSSSSVSVTRNNNANVLFLPNISFHVKFPSSRFYFTFHSHFFFLLANHFLPLFLVSLSI